MNDVLSSKLTLYDILAMLIPGAFILVIFVKCTNIQIDGLIPILFFITGSYLVGIVYYRIIEYLWSLTPFRNNWTDIQASFLKVYKGINDEQKGNQLFDSLIKTNIYNGEKIFKDAYYEAYAFVQKNTYRNVVNVLESQIAFLRSLFLIVLLYFIYFSLHFTINHIVCDTVIPMFFYIVALSFIICKLLEMLILLMLLPICLMQNKIYEIVWEDYEYLSRIKNKDK